MPLKYTSPFLLPAIFHHLRAPRSNSGAGEAASVLALALAGLVTFLTAQPAQAQPGQIDPSFQIADLRSVASLGVSHDGRILIGGVFTAATGNVAAVARLAPDGTLEWRSDALATTPYVLVASESGDILAGGDNRATRFIPPTTAADATFASGNGWRSMDPWVAAFQPDRSLLLGGSGNTAAVMDWQAERSLRTLPLRIQPNGARDSAFGTRVGTGPCFDIAVHPDGSFLALRGSIQRFLADGTPDPSFTPWPASNVELLQRLPSGQYLIGGGTLTSFNGTPCKNLALIDANGHVVPTFNYAGTFDVTYGGAGPQRAVTVLPDGRIVALQRTGGIQRFLADGSLDPTWSDPAPAITAGKLVSDARGQVYVAAFLEGNGTSKPLYRLIHDDSGPVDRPPQFTTQPVALTAFTPGASLTLSADVSGRPDPALQWWFNGTPLPGKTNAQLALAGLSAAQAGTYFLEASNRLATVRSTPAQVFLNPGNARPGTPDVTFEPPPLNPPPGTEGFVATTVNPLFWGGAATPDHGIFLWGNFVTRYADASQHLGVVRLRSDGSFQTSFRPEGRVRDAGAGILLPDGRLVLGAVFEFEGTLRNGLVQLLPEGTSDPAFRADALFEGTIQAGVRVLVRQPDGRLLAGGAFARVANQARPGLVRLLADGTLDGSLAALPLSSRVSAIALASDGDIYLAGSFSLPGATTEVTLIRLNPDGTRDEGFTPVRTISGIVGLEALPTGGVVGLTAGVAQSSPVTLNSLFRLHADGSRDTTFDAGLPNRIGSALLRRADGSFLVAGEPGSTAGAPSIARHLSGGALDPFYTNGPVLPQVRAVLQGTVGRSWLVAAQLPGAVRLQADDYVPPVPPRIVKQPQGISASGLTFASFRVVADGVRPLTYQWRFNGSPLAGATADTLIIAPITPDKLGAYEVVVTGGGGSTTSDTARLSNLFPPVVTTPPIQRTNVIEGAAVTLSVAATGTEPLAFQWRFNGTDLTDQTSPTLTLADLRLDQQGLYTVVVRNEAGSVESSATDLKVAPRPVAPSITREPEDVTLIAGISRACLEPGVTGSAPLSFQWLRDGTALPGAIANSLCLGPLAESEGGLFRLVVTNALGRAETRQARVTVVPPVFAITRPPASLNLIPDRAAAFSVAVRNDAGRPLTFRWQRNDADLPGATNETLRLDPPSPADVQARFRVLVSDGVTTLTSPEALATAVPEIFLCPSPAASIFRVRGNSLPIHLAVDARGFGTLSYQWRKGPAQIGQAAPLSDFVAVPSATSTTLTLATPTDSDAGDYFCEVRSEFGSSVVEAATQLSAIRVRLVDDDTRPGRVDFTWDSLTLGDIWALNGVRFLPDGRVLVAGAFGTPSAGCTPLRVLARLLPNGTLDSTFTPVTATFGTAVGLVRQPSGKLVIAGDFRGIPGLPDRAPGLSMGWVRVQADGTTDPTFSTPETAFDGSGGIQIAGQSDGRIVFVRASRVHRLQVDGARDAAFGGPVSGSDIPGIQPFEGIRRLIVDAQDRLYLLGASAVRRYTPNGAPDPSWAVTTVPENLIRMDLGADGRVVATGYAPGVDGALRVVRFNADGSRDAGFSPDYPAGGTIAGAPGVQADGRILIAGTAGTLSARLLPDGARDATWDAMASPGGVSSPAYDPYWFFGPDGRALIAGFAFDEGIRFSTPGQRQLLRLNNGGGAAGQLRLETPRFLDGRIVFSLPTEPGRTYEIQFVGALGGAGGGITQGWNTSQTITGDGTAKSVTLGMSGTLGFYRVKVTP